MTSTYNDTEWTIEPADYEVGIFGETITHETCPLEDDGDATIDSTRVGAANARGEAEFTFTLSCSCGATESWTDLEYVGRDDEQF